MRPTIMPPITRAVIPRPKTQPRTADSGKGSIGLERLMSYDLRLIRPGYLAWATSGSLSRVSVDRHSGCDSAGRRLAQDRQGSRNAGWQAAIQNRPEVFGGLKLGRVPGQVDEPDPIRHSQV